MPSGDVIRNRAKQELATVMEENLASMYCDGVVINPNDAVRVLIKFTQLYQMLHSANPNATPTTLSRMPSHQPSASPSATSPPR